MVPEIGAREVAALNDEKRQMKRDLAAVRKKMQEERERRREEIEKIRRRVDEMMAEVDLSELLADEIMQELLDIFPLLITTNQAEQQEWMKELKQRAKHISASLKVEAQKLKKKQRKAKPKKKRSIWRWLCKLLRKKE